MISPGEEKYRYWCSLKGSEPVIVGEVGLNPKSPDELFMLLGFEDDGAPYIGKLTPTDAWVADVIKANSEGARTGAFDAYLERKRTIGPIVFFQLIYEDFINALQAKEAEAVG